MIGSTVSHYRILERIGGGGMGVVYKALDLKLDRPVALKFLAAQRGAAEEHKRRFMREARAASALDHPNICTIYEIDETADGALFIAMALCEGETLRDRIARGPLPVADAVAIAEQIAAGLARAHERGIVHRDVKPANVMVAPGGGVKLVDFGIAKLADQSRLTRAGAAVGTAGYMSPEQLHGEPADPRSDVWSLGVVIYEMITGRTPFAADSENEMIRAILKRDPRPMAALRPGVPAALERLVERALAKRPEERTPSMNAMSAELRQIATALAASSHATETDVDRTLRDLPAPPDIPSIHGAPVEDDEERGRRIGPYEMLEILGGGGMGIVYKARDTRLSRIVALKFLPPELTRDPQAKERFEQEARAASSLDHPNLCTILELGETPDGRLYLAMPCYDGETLRRRIERGPLPVDEAVDIALQIARGLSKAHRNGIIHRDIKPANLIVTSDGVVKILDFGLAKLAGSAAISQTGSSAGTPAYMSPEQARGDEVDPRTDLWSLGVVLYELLSGRRPFRGEREQAVIYSILNERPQPLRELRPEVSPELARIVERLMAKEPSGRYPSVEEALGDLRVLRGEPATGFTRAVEPARPRGRPWGWIAAGAAALALIVVAILLPRRGGGGAPVQTSFTRLTDQEGSETFPSVSPDGRDFVYVKLTSAGNLDIYAQRVGGSNPRNLTADSPADDTQPAFSPDGGTIAFRSDRDGGGIFLMGATGESVRRLTDFGYNPAWSPDGKDLLVATEGVSDPRVRKTRSEVWRVEVATGARRRLMEGDAVQPSWSPHGWRIVYWGIATGSARALWTIPAGGGPPVLVLRDNYLNWSPVWSPDGQHLYFASNRGGSMNLWRVPIDEASGRTAGAPEAITAPSEWNGLPSLSRDGKRILYATSEIRTNLERASLDPGSLAVGRLEPVTQGSRGIRSCDVSPDGRWVAFHASIPQEDLFVVRTDGSNLRQLTNDAFRDRYPRWSPDGSRLLFQSDRGGTYGIWSIRADGSGLEPVTRTSDGTVAYPAGSPDGRWLALIIPSRGGALVDLSLPLAQRHPVPFPPIDGTGQLFDAVSWSPDGKRLAGVADTQGSSSVPGAVLYSPASRSYTRLTDRGEVPVWMPGGRALLAQEEGRLLAIDAATRSLREIFALPPNSSFISHCVSPDGRALFVSRASEEGDIGMLTLQ